MKTPRRTVTIVVALAVVSCALVLTLRSFAQTPTPTPPASFDLKIDGWQKLKAPYDDDVDGENGYEKIILRKHTKKYCITHRKNNGDQSHHCPKPAADASQSKPIPVANESSVMPVSDRPAGTNVTQNISCANATDLKAVLDTFDTTGR